MGSINRQIQANNDKLVLKKISGKTPKHRCPVCHRFTIWFTPKGTNNKECYWCYQESRKRLEAKANGITKMIDKMKQEKKELEVKEND